MQSRGASLSSSPFKTWPEPEIESRGDYVEEMFLEEYIGGPLYSQELKNLPIPSLRDTITRFLPTALPLTESAEERKSLIEACHKFEDEAQELQRRLEELKDQATERRTSWLQKWWNQIAYLQFREPVVVNVSYFFQLDDDPTIDTKSNPDAGIKRAASILTSVAEFRKNVCSGKLSFDSIGGRNNKEPVPLCSVAYKYMFNSCRIPGENADTFKLFDPSLFSHCVVARKGLFFSINFVDPYTHDPLPIEVLENQIVHCITMADDIISNTNNVITKYGYLPSQHRDEWYKSRTKLTSQDYLRESLNKIETSAFILCLDDDQPISMKTRGEKYWHGGKAHGPNRWFDKTIQVIISDNGKAGVMGEHSMMDGMPTINLCDHIMRCSYGSIKKQQQQTMKSETYQNIGNSSLVEQLFVDNDKSCSEVVDDVFKAKVAFEGLVDRNELQVHVHSYGSAQIKDFGYSPDAYIQVAMQLASYRLFGKQVGTYESCQVRAFRHGRTETIRGVSPASALFVRAMDIYSNCTTQIKRALLLEATRHHTDFSRQASCALGVDRHFLGLSLLIRDNDQEIVPSLFEHPVFKKSKHWRLSTSTLPYPPGFGPVVSDGVGIAYCVQKDSIYFCITSLKDNKGWCKSLSQLLEETLYEMGELHDESNVDNSRSTIRSRL